MNAVLAEPLTTSCNQSSSIDATLAHKGQKGRNPSCSAASSPTVLADIYQDDINVAIWQRNFDESLVAEINEFIAANPNFSKSVSVSPVNAFDKLEFATDGTASRALLEDMAELVDMFCCLFELEEVGLRLAVLNKAMCPRFHFDQVPCRLVTTYHGIATQWLENDSVDRSKLGRGSNGQPDSASGLYNDESDIQQMAAGDVALLKGERWSGNENRGLVHRSPVTSSEEARLLLTIDFG